MKTIEMTINIILNTLNIFNNGYKFIMLHIKRTTQSKNRMVSNQPKLSTIINLSMIINKKLAIKIQTYILVLFSYISHFQMFIFYLISYFVPTFLH